MPKNPTFELFEVICDELANAASMVLVDEDLDATLIADLKKAHKQTEAARAVDAAVAEMTAHFESKVLSLPFTFSAATRYFEVTDPEFVQFIALARAKRGVGGADAKQFEVQVAARLAQRVTGLVHHVGTPRSKANSKKERFLKYLMGIGWGENALEPHDKDGGLDILWMPPLGALPLRPFVSVQCKNSSFDEDDAAASAARAIRTLSRHRHVAHHHMVCVVFNDYIDKSYHAKANGWIFLPLGLTDFGRLVNPTETRTL
jgi:hypothetical protein